MSEKTMQQPDSLFITSLNSGSNGNCFYIGNHDEAVLIDAGISCRETERRMSRLGLPMTNIKAIFISHEHSDHVTGLPILAKKYRLPVYITNRTLESSGMFIDQELIRSFAAYKPVMIGGLTVTAFPKFHDADDPHSFMISSNQINVGVFTDIGHCCEHVKYHFKECHAAFLETNYCEYMLRDGSYPEYLKKRISGKKGHLSNIQALELFKGCKGGHLSHLILSHLSKNNNRPELVDRIFKECAGFIKIVIASRYEETEIYEIKKGNYSPVAPKKHPNRIKTKTVHAQLSLFD